MQRFALVLLVVVGTGLFAPPALGAGPNGAASFPPGTFFTVSVVNVLEHYNLAAPGQVLGAVNILGLDPGEDILGIDFRPATGQLYGLGSSDQLYIIDTVTGKASPVGSTFTPALDGVHFGFDFNPTTDRIRVVSNTGQNLRLNPNTGQVAAVDAAINPASAIEASAHTNNRAGATSTTLYAINPAADQLVIQSPPNNGTVTPVGSLGVNAGAPIGFDIAPGSNTAYAAIFPGELPSLLYTINLATGAATLVGGIGGVNAARGLAIVAGPETVFGVSTSNKLVSFRSNTPGLILSTSPITGLQGGENILGIDFRPATGQLYGLGSTSRIYRINIVTGAATQVGTGTFTPALAGTDFGFDFNPTVDRIRIVSNTEQNLRAHPDLGTISFTDTPLTPAGNVVAAAYTNNFAGATSTTLYDMDSVTDLLLTQNPPNDGVLNAVGPLGVDASGLTGFDIATSGMAFASITLQGAASTNFYGVNLATGATTLVGTIGGGELIRDTAVRVYTEVVYGVTQAAGPTNNLIRFNAATPNILISSVPITGLQAGEVIHGIDFRPTSGQLFGLGSTSRLYTINPATGVATQVGTGTFSTLLNGTGFGFDLNPATDGIRVVSNTDQNLRLNPSTGAVAAVDSALNPAANIIVAAAYKNNFAGVTSTTLYDIDLGLSLLLTQNPPNDGVLNLVGSLGISIANTNVGFDIARGSGHAYLSTYTDFGGATPGFYKVNLSTGATTLIGNVNTTDILIDISVLLELEEEIFSDGFE
jgi:hypothetical protein